jgi:hypothetical protein
MVHSRRASSTHTRFQLERLEESALLSGLAYSLTANESSYQPGQPIQISLTVTNTSSQPIETFRGADLDHFVVTENGVQVWESGSFMLPLAESVTLQPGQSFTDTDTWNGVPNGGPPTVLRVVADAPDSKSGPRTRSGFRSNRVHPSYPVT